MMVSTNSGTVRGIAEPMHERPTNLGQGLMRLAFAVEAVYARASRDLDLTSQQAQLLCAVGLASDENGRPVAINRPTPVGRLAAALHCDQSNASHLVERAVKRGLLTRRRGADKDGRVTLVELTDAGRRRLDEFTANLLNAEIEPRFAAWPPERQAAALETLNSLADTLDEVT
jgi:DNA-binding MarR family transcriptional regulator